MRKMLIIAICVLVSINSFAQPKPDNKSKTVIPDSKDTAKLEVPVDSIAIASAVDIANYMAYLKKSVSYEAYVKLTPDQVMQNFYVWAVQEWNRKKKVKK